jgi:hypothetical protein
VIRFYGQNNNLTTNKHILKIGTGRWSQGKDILFRVKASRVNLERAAHSSKSLTKQMISLHNILSNKNRIKRVFVEKGLILEYEIKFLSQSPKGNVKTFEVTETIKEQVDETFELKVGRGRWKKNRTSIVAVQNKRMHWIQQACFSGRKTIEEQTIGLQRIFNHESVTSQKHIKYFEYKVELKKRSPRDNVRVYNITRQRRSQVKSHDIIDQTTGRNATSLRNSIKGYTTKRLKAYGANLTVPFKELLGCNKDRLLSWIESQWEHWMNWNNHVSKRRGKKDKRKFWNIDHLIALNHPDIDLTDENDLRKVVSYKNLFPVSVSENSRKGHLSMSEWVQDKPFYFFDISNNFCTFEV